MPVFIDCGKFAWQGFHIALNGQYYDRKEGKLAMIDFEVWCDRDFYVWDSSARRYGTNNDNTIVSISPLFSDILSGRYVFKMDDTYRFTENSVARDLPYFLADGFYSSCHIFIRRVHRRDNKGQEVKQKEA